MSAAGKREISGAEGREVLSVAADRKVEPMDGVNIL